MSQFTIANTPRPYNLEEMRENTYTMRLESPFILTDRYYLHV